MRRRDMLIAMGLAACNTKRPKQGVLGTSERVNEAIESFLMHDVDPSPRYLSQLGKVIAREKVTFIFTEPQFSDRLARRLADDLKVGIASLDTLEAGTLAATSYEDGMRANLRVLQRSLK